MALITFLRGVNVGGHRSFRPSILANQLRNYGVVNIGAAGTFVVCSRLSQKRWRSELLPHIPFEAKIMICTGQELVAAASNNPFDDKTPSADIVRFVSIMSERPRRSPSIPVCIPPRGKWLVKILSRHNRFLFGIYRREMRAITCLGAIDDLFGVTATTRNWNTITSILKVLERA